MFFSMWRYFSLHTHNLPEFENIPGGGCQPIPRNLNQWKCVKHRVIFSDQLIGQLHELIVCKTDFYIYDIYRQASPLS